MSNFIKIWIDGIQYRHAVASTRRHANEYFDRTKTEQPYILGQDGTIFALGYWMPLTDGPTTEQLQTEYQALLAGLKEMTGFVPDRVTLLMELSSAGQLFADTAIRAMLEPHRQETRGNISELWLPHFMGFAELKLVLVGTLYGDGYFWEVPGHPMCYGNNPNYAVHGIHVQRKKTRA
jgi:hypothetical protein